MTFPWSPNAGEFWQPTPRIPDGFLSGLVSLHAESVDGQAVLLLLLEAQPLYGSNEVPRSLLRLMPGRAARIRVPTQLSAAMPEGRARIFQQPEGAIRVRAVFSMRIDNFPLTRSTNTIPIRVFPRQLQ